MVDGTPQLLIVVDDPADVGARADVVLVRRVPGLSRRIVRAQARAGRLRIDGKPAPSSTPVALGMRIELEPLPSADALPLPALDVLRTTDDFVFVDKPAGVHTVRVRADDPPTLADAVVDRFPECATASDDPRDGGALHRLDRETTGVVAFARSADAWRRGRAAFETPTAARKLYLAVCQGTPTPWPPALPGVTPVSETFPDAALMGALPFAAAPLSAVQVDVPLRAHGPRGASVRADPEGDFAVSLVRPLQTPRAGQEPPVTWVCLRLVTGRRHQARVHLATLGLPVIGDARYGSGQADGPMLLHAWALDLGLPAAGRGPVLAPLPSAFLRLA